MDAPIEINFPPRLAAAREGVRHGDVALNGSVQRLLNMDFDVATVCANKKHTLNQSILQTLPGGMEYANTPGVDFNFL